MEESKYFMYVLLCSDRTFYGGYTNDLKKRIKKHNSGNGAKYTKTRRPVKLIFYKQFNTKSEALKAEYAFKHQSRKKKENFLLENGVPEKYLKK
ncbi:GIY-YIG nuclease family protein [Ligilactobacillus cholophilus]|uniref:GIY-YIG nuclease family protein n=1 Tax=Ligilactobacillus cholophilus TaxID=3050131 RepID=UPI0025B0FC4A|nr:GIY-YIG nuclease family protein [Ligilactobacillus cholophilus]